MNNGDNMYLSIEGWKGGEDEGVWGRGKYLVGGHGVRTSSFGRDCRSFHYVS